MILKSIMEFNLSDKEIQAFKHKIEWVLKAAQTISLVEDSKHIMDLAEDRVLQTRDKV